MTTEPADDAHLRETRVAGETVFRGGFLHAVRDTVALPDGKHTTREYILHSGAVMVIALQDDGRVVLERQYRHPVGQVLIEFPAGKLDPGEAPLTCARRELLEETGYSARDWAYAGALHPAIAYSDEIIHIWFARGLTLTQPQLDEGEFLEVMLATPAELIDWCAQGRVRDAKTLAGCLWLQNVLAGTWTLDWRT